MSAAWTARRPVGWILLILEVAVRFEHAETIWRDFPELAPAVLYAEGIRPDVSVDARVAQFRERVAQFESQAAKARAAGDTRRAEQAEGQAEQWREWLATAEQAVNRR